MCSIHEDILKLNEVWTLTLLAGLGGGLLPADVKSTDADAATKMTGSFIIAQAESIDAIWALIKKDIFYTSGEVVRGIPQQACDQEH